MSVRTQACNYQFQTNGDDLQFICLEQGQDYSLAVIKAESLYQLVYLGFICYKLKLIDAITIPTSLSIMINTIMLSIYSTVKISVIKMYVIIYHVIKLIMLRIHLKHSSNQ